MTYQDITLVAGTTTVTLPGDMKWIDRRSRNVVSQNIEVAANGAVIFEEFQQLGGFPVTLVGAGADDTWVTQDTIDALITLADTPQTAPMTLTYNDGTVITVRFVYDTSKPAVDAAPVMWAFPFAGTDGYSLTLRLQQANA